ncbi:MAG: hypothetical protein CME32_00085 [Gimesia sp.]|nr:hypothetical protein [Gimesia sp.]
MPDCRRAFVVRCKVMILRRDLPQHRMGEIRVSQDRDKRQRDTVRVLSLIQKGMRDRPVSVRRYFREKQAKRSVFQGETTTVDLQGLASGSVEVGHQTGGFPSRT